MRLISKLYSQIEQRFINRADERTLMLAAEKKRVKTPSGQLTYDGKTMLAKSLRDWKEAIALASDSEYPDRTFLSDLYENLMLDGHLASVIDSRILRVQRSPFRLAGPKGKEDDELKKLLERPWLETLIRQVLFSKFQGTTLLELYEITDDMELTAVHEIPQSHFLPNKGMIIKEIGDTDGWNYRTGVLADYYLQIGDNRDLGMLAKLAPIVLAKKLGMGSWLDYIEKFGVPALFISTDREDQTRLNELFEAAENFRSNQFIVGRGREKFEVGSVGNVDAHNTFNRLIERANSEISKRVLGQTMTTDDGSSRAQAQVHERVADDRHQSDKLFFKFIFNNQIRPRLVKLSPVYTKLTNHTWEWDDTETMDTAAYIDAVAKLAIHFDMDAKAVAERTGIPVTSAKSHPSSTENEKKKSVTEKHRSDIETYYAHIPDPDLQLIDLSGWEALIDRIAGLLYNKKLKPAALNRELLDATYDELAKGAADGYGKQWGQFNKGYAQNVWMGYAPTPV